MGSSNRPTLIGERRRGNGGDNKSMRLSEIHKTYRGGEVEVLFEVRKIDQRLRACRAGYWRLTLEGITKAEQFGLMILICQHLPGQCVITPDSPLILQHPPTFQSYLLFDSHAGRN